MPDYLKNEAVKVRNRDSTFLSLKQHTEHN